MALSNIKSSCLQYNGGNLYRFYWKRDDGIKSFNVHLINDDWYVEVNGGFIGEMRPLSTYEQCNEALNIINELYIPLTLNFND